MRKLLIIMVCIVIAGCGGDSGSPAATTGTSTAASTTGSTTYIPSNTVCTSIMNDVLTKSGAPEEIKNYDTSDGYHNRDWWYWSRGFEYSFTWAPFINGCSVSTYTFTPIRKPVSLVLPQ